MQSTASLMSCLRSNRTTPYNFTARVKEKVGMPEFRQAVQSGEINSQDADYIRKLIRNDLSVPDQNRLEYPEGQYNPHTMKDVIPYLEPNGKVIPMQAVSEPHLMEAYHQNEQKILTKTVPEGSEIAPLQSGAFPAEPLQKGEGVLFAGNIFLPNRHQNELEILQSLSKIAGVQEGTYEKPLTSSSPQNERPIIFARTAMRMANSSSQNPNHTNLQEQSIDVKASFDPDHTYRIPCMVTTKDVEPTEQLCYPYAHDQNQVIALADSKSSQGKPSAPSNISLKTSQQIGFLALR